MGWLNHCQICVQDQAAPLWRTGFVSLPGALVLLVHSFGHLLICIDGPCAGMLRSTW